MERFVVGTGRCGSTLLSNMLACCPDVLSIFELFTGLDWSRRFALTPVDGAALADLLGWEQKLVTEVTRRGYRVPEITYPFRDAGGAGRFAAADGLPWLLVAMLPPLTPDPDALFDRLIAFARARPVGSLRDHYLALFEWLGKQLGRHAWIERSGSSIEYLGSLRDFFPRARFVHLHRDGHEVALSMQEHAPYRLAVSLLYDWRPPGGGGSDLMTTILESHPPAALFGRYCSDQLLRGFRALPSLDASQYLAVKFEDLVREPRRELERITSFFELPGSRGWIHDAAALVAGVPPTRFEKLSPDEQTLLADACRPGQQLIGRAP